MNEVTQFRIHTGEIVRGRRLMDAFDAGADNRIKLANAIREEDAYAPHVTEQQKEDDMLDMLESAERIRAGTEKMGFWLWQLINTQLTGECVPFFNKS